MRSIFLAGKSSLWQWAIKSREGQNQRGSPLQGRLKGRSINMPKSPSLSRSFLTHAPTCTSATEIYRTLSARVAKTSKKLKTSLASTLTSFKQTESLDDPKIVKKRRRKKLLQMPKLISPTDTLL